MSRPLHHASHYPEYLTARPERTVERTLTKPSFNVSGHIASTVFVCLTQVKICFAQRTRGHTIHKLDTMGIHSPSWFVLSHEATANLQQSALIPAVLFTTLALPIVVLRWYSRTRLAPRTWHVEDVVVTAALVCARQDPGAIRLTIT